MINTRVRWKMSAAAAAIALLTTSACGSGSSKAANAGQPAGKTLTTLHVGIIPLIDVAPIFLGEKLGYFAQAGLSIKTTTVQTGAAAVAAVVSGDLNIGFSAPVPELSAIGSGIPIRVVASAVVSEAGSNQVLVKPDSSIKSPSDLTGKTIAVNALKAADQLYDQVALKKLGVNPSSVHFVAIPFPNQVSALGAGQVQAVTTAEPFLTEAAQSGSSRVLIHDLVGEAMGFQGAVLSSWFTSASYLASHHAVIEAFVKALQRTDAYATAHPDAIRQIVASYTSIPSTVLSKIHLPTFSAAINPHTYSVTASQMLEFGYVQSLPSASTLAGGA